MNVVYEEKRCKFCSKLLGRFRIAFGIIRCPRCSKDNQINIGGEPAIPSGFASPPAKTTALNPPGPQSAAQPRESHELQAAGFRPALGGF